MIRYCANCGTEVDETALFCPTCGQPIEAGTQTELPAAPAWPEPEPRPEARGEHPAEAPRAAPPTDEEAVDEPVLEEEPLGDTAHAAPTRSAVERPTPVEEELREPEAGAAPPPRSLSQRAAARRASGEGRPQGDAGRPDLPITTPVTLSGWLIGIGALLGALGALISLFDGFGVAVDLVLLVALLAVAATVFAAANLPAIPHQRLATLVIVLIGAGVGLDRLALGGAGVGELLVFLGTAAAAIGAILVELGQDQPLGSPPS